MHHIRKLLMILPALLIFGCAGVTYRLSQQDLAWVPYSPSDVLIFKNNVGDVDTILISAVNKFTAPEDPLAVTSKNHEHLVVGGYFSEPEKAVFEQRSANILYLRLSAGKNGSGSIDFNVVTSHAKFYQDSTNYDRGRFDSLPRIKLTTTYAAYENIVMVPVLKGMRNMGDPDYRLQSNFVTALYWSKKNGIVRYDLKNGQSWVLSERYSAKK